MSPWACGEETLSRTSHTPTRPRWDHPSRRAAFGGEGAAGGPLAPPGSPRRGHRILAELVQRLPLRERFHEQLVLALYRPGASGSAAGVRGGPQDAQGGARPRPWPDLRALERAVLRHDPALGLGAAEIGALRAARCQRRRPIDTPSRRECRWAPTSTGVGTDRS
jgi:hypothetical protein